MSDSLTAEHRSRNMAAIKGKNTKPELDVRRFLHHQGYRYRLHRKDLPGKPDITLTKYRAVLFINGCFWHRHENCRLAYNPKSNSDFWQQKFQKNVENDLKKHQSLRDLGWKVIVIWECEIKNRSYREWICERIKN
ncbi:very short patch repair endonuclease [Legionella sp. CNM-4043-24]|uniref:very short patch repair endonuclease n=1 Tax=Legionella sp. CNM-4043-24 TaxID=3421646 RepID=UPI00403B08B7